MSRELKRVPWTPQEDERLRRFVARYGPNHWSTAAHRAQLLRDTMSIRTRWHFYLAPGIKRGAITAEEEEDIIRLHAIHGDNWFDIAWKLPGRTSKDVRDHWREHLSQRLVTQGIDPRTHKPLAAEAETSSSRSQQSTEDGDWEMVPLQPEPSPSSAAPRAGDDEDGDTKQVV